MKPLLCALGVVTLSAAAIASAQAALTGVSAVAGVSSGREATLTRAFPFPARAIDLGPVAGDQPLRLVVGLRVRDRRAIDALLRRQLTPGDPLFGRFLTPAQTTALFNPTGATVQAVSNGLPALPGYDYVTGLGSFDVTLQTKDLPTTYPY